MQKANLRLGASERCLGQAVIAQKGADSASSSRLRKAPFQFALFVGLLHQIHGYKYSELYINTRRHTHGHSDSRAAPARWSPSQCNS